MTHPLDGCVARIDWAESHFKALQPAIESHNIDPDPTGDPLLNLDADFERGKLAVRVARETVLPPLFGLLFGEVVRGLHATLDNLVYALGSINNKIPADDRASAFPILKDANAWFSDSTKAKLRWVAPRDRTRIETYQPFMENAGRKPADDALARIARYSNDDKHKVIPTTAAAFLGVVVHNIDAVNCRVLAPEVDKLVWLSKDAVILRADIVDIRPEPRVHMQGAFRWIPVLQDGDAVQSFCEEAIAYVRLIIESFRASFP